MLQITKASKKYGSNLVLNQIDMHIHHNSITGLAGPSGSGKSTLLRCIQGLEALDSGLIEYSGVCGFMFQDFQLFPHMNVLDNLVFAPKLKHKQYNHEPRAMELLNQLSISDKALTYPQHLSGGQKQRVALARSLMLNPDLLLCDEPTSGLDTVSIKEVVELLTSIQSMNITMMIASHDLAFLAQVAERMLVMKQGSLVADFNTNQDLDLIAYVHQLYQGEAL